MRLFYSLLILIFFCHMSQADQLDDLIQGNFEEISKILWIIDHCFLEKKNDIFKRITLKEFQKTKRYKTFTKYSTQYLINFNYRTEICIKPFAIKDKKEHLMIQFVKDNDTQMWCIDDAYLLLKNKKKKKLIKQNFLKLGFSPLSYEQNFENFVQMLETKEKNSYLALGKYGTLNIDFLNSNQLIITKNCQLIYTDIIIYSKENKIIDVVYLTFERFPSGHKDQNMYKGGWLLTDVRNMKEFYPKGENLYLDFLLNRMTDIDLNTSNNYFYTVNIEEFINRMKQSEATVDKNSQ